MDRVRIPLPAILALFLLSGATSLVYEVVWLRKLILIFGSTQFATSTILSTFMGGLALGAFLGGRWLGQARIRPLRWYGVLEIAIGAYALIVPFLFDGLSPVYRLLWNAGASESFLMLSLAKFVGIAAVLLPPTVMMGATLPLLAREIADDPERIGGKVGALYAINTFGAVAGTFVAGFVALPYIGAQATLLSTASVNGLLGLAAISLGARTVATRPADAVPHDPASRLTPGRIKLALLAFGLSGFGALVLEVAWTRVLALVMGSSVYAFSLMLVAFLIGLAAGSAWFSRHLRRKPHTDPAALLVSLLASAGVLAYATTWLFSLLPRIFGEIYYRFSPETHTLFLVQFAFGLMIMFPATFALGGIFPAVLQIHARGLDRVAGSVGVVYASNTTGTILGAAIAGFVLLPQLGVQPTVIAIALLELGLALLVLAAVVPRERRRGVGAVLIVALAAVVAFVRPTWDTRLMNAGVYMNLFGTEDEGWEGFEKIVYGNNEILYAAEGLTSSVFVARQPEYDNIYLSVNGKIEASSQADLETQLMASHLPLLLHADPHQVMVIGLASGITVGAAASHPVDSIRVVEVEKAMIPAAREFDEFNGHVLDDPRVRISVNDARNELEFSDATYDVIISEPSNPWMTVAANLFTEDFFRMAKTRVREDGLFCQWLQNYYLPRDDMRSIVAAFQASFPEVMLFETFDGVDLLMVGSRQPLGFRLDELSHRMSELKVRMDLGRAYAKRPEDILSLFRLGPDDVRRLVDGAPRNTDDNARVEFSAPKTLGWSTLDRNIEFLRKYTTDPVEMIRPPLTDPAERDRIQLYLADRWARRGYADLARGAAERVSPAAPRERVEAVLERVRRLEQRADP